MFPQFATHHAIDDETIGFQQEVARLQALLEASRRIHGALKIDEVLHCTLEIAVKEIEAEGAFFTNTPDLSAAFRTTYGNVSPEARAPGLHPAFALHDKLGRELTTLVIVRPSRPLTLEERDFMEGLALQSAVAIETSRQHEQLLAWDRVQYDLESARRIQQSLLPRDIPDIPGYAVDYRSNACYEVGGDYLDILKLPDGCYTMIVADVAGKGLASALMAGSFRSAFRAMALTGLPLAEFAARMNDLHHAEGEEAQRRYVTAILLRLDPQAHTLECLNAGHNAGFLLDAAGNHTLVRSSGAPLGMFAGSRYTVERHHLPAGGKLLFYTDGLVEVFRGREGPGEEFGERRLLEAFRKSAHIFCGGLLDFLLRQLREFTDRPQQSDDMTALALFRDPGDES